MRERFICFQAFFVGEVIQFEVIRIVQALIFQVPRMLCHGFVAVNQAIQER